LQRGRLGTWKPLDTVEHGPDELMQGRERQLRLGLDAGPPQHPHPPGGTVGGVGEQRRLADTNLAAKHQRATALPARSSEQAIDGFALLLAAVEHGSMVASGGARPATATGGSLLAEAEERVARGNGQRVPQMRQPGHPA
jgi:hypothetical protein